MSPEQYDQHWMRIYDDARADGLDPDAAEYAADRDTEEQFGPRPEEP